MTQFTLRARVKQTLLELLQGDLVKQDTEAIVNAANSSLLGGGGVDGAIHRAAGRELLEETRTLGGAATGEAKISGGYHLKAQYVIHAVGPVYRNDDERIPLLLASAYRRSLEVAVENDVRTVAFPSISTGAYGYPVDKAAPIALGTVCEFLEQSEKITLVRFVLYDDTTLKAYSRALNRLIRQYPDRITPT